MADDLTDQQLRKELISYGEKSIGPITASTRTIYIKKLNHLKARRKSSTKATGRKQTGKKLLGFSSDESEDDAEGRSTFDRSLAGPSSTRSEGSVVKRTTTSRKASRPSQPLSRMTHDLVRPSLKRRSRARGQNSTLELESDDDPSMVSAMAQTSFTSDITDNSALDVESMDFNDSIEDSFNLNMRRGDLPEWNAKESSDSDIDIPGSSQISSRLNDSLSSQPSPRSLWNTSRTHPSASVSQHNTSHSNRMTSPDSSFKSTGNAKHGRKSTSIKSQCEKLPKTHGFKTHEEPASHHPYISMFLLVFVGLFFATLGFMYMNVTSEEAKAENLMLCPEKNMIEDGSEQGSDDCFTKTQVQGASPIIKDLAANLSQEAGLYECGYSSSKYKMSIHEAIHFMKSVLKHGVGRGTDYSHDVDVALTLFSKNPQWKVKMLDTSGRDVGENIKDVYYLVSEDPEMSLWCRLTKSVSQVLKILLALGAVAAGVCVIIALVRYRWRCQEEETKEIYSMVEKILNILRVHHEAYLKSKEENKNDIQPYLAIPHVRDMLIAPKERRKKQGIWDKAVKFISENESRVRVEIQTIAGEEFTVWRWLQSCTNGRKVWQGQAFGEKESYNMPMYSPTACLKIRNMFDADVEYGEDWHIYIQDAILEKCGPNHEIVHIAVDKTSKEGCVYAKCCSAEAAGRVYRSLHGWWFDGVLVTVKYLRLERYYERFPDARSADKPLQPSNDEKRSVSLPYHRSITETS